MDTFTVHIIIASTCNSIRGKKFLLGSFPDPIPGLGTRLTGNHVMVWTHFVEPKHLRMDLHKYHNHGCWHSHRPNVLPQSYAQPLTSLFSLHTLQSRYPSTVTDLQGIFDGIHLLVGPAGGSYQCVLVDDLHKYFAPLQVNTSHYIAEG